LKKIIVAILSVLYLGTATGATIHMHYCMGKLIDWSLWNKGGDLCGKCGMKKDGGKKNDCCKDDYKFVKNITDHKSAESALQLMQGISFAVPSAFVEIPVDIYSSVTEKNSRSHAPPRSGGTAVYIRNCVFRI